MRTAPVHRAVMRCSSEDTDDSESDSSTSSEENSDEDSDEESSQTDSESKASEESSDSDQQSSEDDTEEESSENEEDKNSDETSEDSDSNSEEPDKSVETITRSFQKFSLDGVRNFAEVLSALAKQKPDSAKTTLRVVKKIKPDLCRMSRNFKQAHDQIERETKALQKLTENRINNIEQMKIRKEKLEARIQQNEVQLVANKSNVKDLEKNIATLNKQMR